MNFRALLAKGREMLRPARAAPALPQFSEPFGLVALRLERDLARPAGGVSIMVAAADDDAAGMDATLELAWCFGEELGHRVLVIDAAFDLRLASEAFGARDTPGLVELLDQPSPTRELLRSLTLPTQHERIAFLPHGVDAGDAVARAEAIRQLLTLACEDYPVVLLHSSTLVSSSKSMAFSSLIDAALLIAVEERTSTDYVVRGQRLLNETGAGRVALVLVNRPEALPAAP
jgi:hypothetical protein